ncbi:hypothetical protein B0H13DRAFT_2351977 [Mycena leptocephala]|nr:hypothetical protein B0H13DRAFT_2351977 [Mycena leptocephala]
MGFSSIELNTIIYTQNWDADVYAALRQFYRAKGFDPDSQDVARHMGYPLFQLRSVVDPLFAHGPHFDCPFPSIYFGSSLTPPEKALHPSESSLQLASKQVVRLPEIPSEESAGGFTAPFLKELGDIGRSFTPTAVAISQASTQEQRLRTEHPDWFVSPTPSPTLPSAPSSRLPAPQSASTSHTALSRLSQHSFLLVEFREDQKPALVQGIQDPPNFPFWIRPGSELYECYSSEYSTWMHVKPSYVHDLRNKRRILIRAISIMGSDEVTQSRQLVADIRDRDNAVSSPSLLSSPPSTRPSAQTTDKGKKRRIRTPSSDDDIVFVGYGRVIKTEPVTPPPKRRPALDIQIPTLFTPPSLSASTSSGPSSASLPSLESSPVFLAYLLPPCPKPWQF